MINGKNLQTLVTIDAEKSDNSCFKLCGVDSYCKLLYIVDVSPGVELPQ